MFNTLYPRFYKLLRERAGLTQEELAEALKISRSKMNKVESGLSRLDPDEEARLLELSGCNREESAELLCKVLSEHLDKKVGIDNQPGAYEPTTALSLAYELLRERGEELPPVMRRMLNLRIKSTELLGVTYDQNNAELIEMTRDCREELENRRREEARR